MNFLLSGGTLNINLDYLLQYDCDGISGTSLEGIIDIPSHNDYKEYIENHFYRYDNLIYMNNQSFSGSSIDLSSDTRFDYSSILDSLFINSNVVLQLFDKNLGSDIYNEYLFNFNYLKTYLYSNSISGIRLDGNYSNVLINEFINSLKDDYTDYSEGWFKSEWLNKNINLDTSFTSLYSGHTIEPRLIVNNFKCLPNLLLDNISIIETLEYTGTTLNTYSNNIGFEIERIEDNKKSYSSKQPFLLNSKEMDIALNINNALELKTVEYIYSNRNLFNKIIEINIIFDSSTELLGYIKEKYVRVYNHKTVRNNYFISELYKTYIESIIGNLTGYTYNKLNFIIKKLNKNWQNFVEQLINATTIIDSLNKIENNIFMQNNKMRYRRYNINYSSSNPLSTGSVNTVKYLLNTKVNNSEILSNSYSEVKIENYDYNSSFTSKNILSRYSWVANTFHCQQSEISDGNMSNTGYLITDTLVLYDSFENKNTELVKDNIIGTVGYIEPTINLGSCPIYSATKTGTATKNNCYSEYVGTTVTYTVPYGTYTGNTQAEADQLAESDVTGNTQDYANEYGRCLAIPEYLYNVSEGETNEYYLYNVSENSDQVKGIYNKNETE